MVDIKSMLSNINFNITSEEWLENDSFDNGKYFELLNNNDIRDALYEFDRCINPSMISYQRWAGSIEYLLYYRMNEDFVFVFCHEYVHG